MQDKNGELVLKSHKSRKKAKGPLEAAKSRVEELIAKELEWPVKDEKNC